MPEKEIEVGGRTDRDERRPEPPLDPTSTLEEDNSAAVSYLVAERRGEYVAIIDVLEASIADLTPPELTRELAKAGMVLGEDTVEERLDQLRTWGVVSRTRKVRSVPSLRGSRGADDLDLAHTR